MAASAKAMRSGSRGQARTAGAQARRVAGKRPPDGAPRFGACGGDRGNIRPGGEAAGARVRRPGAGDGTRPRFGEVVRRGAGAAATIGESD